MAHTLKRLKHICSHNIFFFCYFSTLVLALVKSLCNIHIFPERPSTANAKKQIEKKNEFIFIIWLYVVAEKADEWRKRLGRHTKKSENMNIFHSFSLALSLSLFHFLLQRAVF